jgi:signal transduction histidine kinase
MHDHRKKTNTSLLQERHRTDEALKATHRELASRTDASIEADRSVSDSELEQGQGSKATSTEVSHGDKQLKKDLDQALETIQVERQSVDAAIEKERAVGEWLDGILLSQERARTDIDLDEERKQTDSDFLTVNQSLEDEQMAHSETRKALLSRDEILAIVSHDLRNPIGTVLSCASMLLGNRSFPQLDPETERWIRTIKRNAESALRLIRNLLDMESLASGKFELVMREVDMSELLRQTAENFAHEAKTRLIALHIRIPDVRLLCRCDPDRILQVLSNLGSNAMKFTPKQGSITLEASRNEASDIEVAMTDNGPGIPIDQQRIIFERYAQLGKNDQSSLGLGLYISNRIIESHRGKLWVEPAEGGGSRFIFTIPGP